MSEMRTECSAFKVGDNGQRYEVRFTDSDGNEKVLGWTNDPSGGGLVQSIELHPTWRLPRVIDRHGRSGL